MKNVLLIPKGFFGDIILTTPAIAALVRSHPDTRVSVVCTPATAEFVRRDPLVHQVIVYDRRGAHRGVRGLHVFARELRGGRFDAAYTFHRSPRTAMLLWLSGIKERVGFSDTYLGFLLTQRVPKRVEWHEVLRNLSLVADGLDQVSVRQFERLTKSPEDHVPWADLRVPEISDEQLSPTVRDIVQGDPYVVLAPGSAWETKRWDLQGFRGVAKTYTARGVRVVLVGAPSDAKVCDGIAEGVSCDNLCGRTSLEELVALIAHARCVVCNDSLALHLCSATKTPVVVIFCATSPRFGFGPWRGQAAVLEKAELFCKPCHRHGARRCPTGTRHCMTGVSVAEVVCAIDRFLGQQGGASPSNRLPVLES